MVEKNNEFQKYFIAGQQALNDQDWLRANEQLEKAYILEQTDAVLLMLVTSLEQSEQYQQAWGLIRTNESLFKTSETQAYLYVEIALANQMYLAAWEFAVTTTWAEELVNKVQFQENKDQVELSQTIKNRARHFFNLSDVNLAEQAERLQTAEMLPRNYYLQGAKTLLVDPFLPAITRSTLVDRLRRLKVSEELEFLWLDQQYKKMIPSQLESLEEIPFWKKLTKALQNGIYQDDPVILEGLERQIYLEMTLSYPHFPTFYLDADAWIQTEMLGLHTLIDQKETPEQEKYHRLLLNEQAKLI
ncbi:restriction endonuclease subunit R [Weissella koreensis]|uniref:hypothetical protein n=1 Tax=Weissella koreensis TaxID=165096 RepID=UPI0002175222|nr:hypothetical protein [Weissella koreensis]AEJ24003.1 Type I site-specific restriction-modification system, R (restriction) subunit [Weissella koreensis KACC 15510]EJF34604.1 hypothetical protein JC2156_14440 [Weissella koreensis KCTC 3621]MCZ9311331.1 restriction endonuclease subunit R [Weissella koreensis]